MKHFIQWWRNLDAASFVFYSWAVLLGVLAVILVYMIVAKIYV